MSLLNRSKTFSATLQGDSSLIYEILIDYDNYFEWLPFVTHSKLLAKEGDLAIAEMELNTHRGAKIAIECVHTKNKSVMSRRISGGVPVHEIVWTLNPSGQGQTEVSLTIEHEADWKRFIPGMVKNVTGDRYLAALKSRAAVFSSDLLDDESGKKVLEVFETDDGLDLWILGKKYVLKPAEEKHD